PPGDPIAPAPRADPAEHLLIDERRRLVHAALGSLPVQQRAAVVLVDMEGYSVAEAARILDCAEGTVKSRCSRARARLAPLLADLLDAGGDGGPAAEPAQTDGNRVSGPHVGSMTRRGPPPARAGLAPPAPTVD